jgi:hypothetical protein
LSGQQQLKVIQKFCVFEESNPQSIEVDYFQFRDVDIFIAPKRVIWISVFTLNSKVLGSTVQK